MSEEKAFIHPSAVVEEGVQLGEGTKIWHFAHVRRDTKIGKNCVIAKSVFIDFESEIGDNCKIQNHAILYNKAIIANGVFVGPNVCFTNDKVPRAINPDGTPKNAADWHVSTIEIGTGASIGAHSVITPGIKLGAWSMVGSGSVVSKDVPDHALVYGNPARIRGFVCKCGKKLDNVKNTTEQNVILTCDCGEEVKIPQEVYKLKI